MSVLLYVVGAIVTMLGIGMAGYGIPINEFSFGNTLIVAGTTAAVGGLILIGIAATIRQMKRIAETLGTGAPIRSGRSLDDYEPMSRSPAPPMPGQPQFQPRPKSEAGTQVPGSPVQTPASADMAAGEGAEPAVMPTLHNPDIPAAIVADYRLEDYEDVSLSPRQPAPARSDLAEPPPPPPFTLNPPPAPEKRGEPTFDDAPWRFPPPASPPPQERQAQPNYFDALWPADSKKRPLAEEPRQEPPLPMAAAPKPPELPPVSRPKAAILKSGVVDGMGYTLYVDGSIEAELPQGTLHFSSINELREHLARNS